MITYLSGSIFNAKCDALVNPVNTSGAAGKGLALEFRKRYPYNYKMYRAQCSAHKVQVGALLCVGTLVIEPKMIINFPTKKHWSQPSRLEYIDSGLEELVNVIPSLQIRSIAVPALGCGCGGLDWADVKLMIHHRLKDLEIDVYVYEPK